VVVGIAGAAVAVVVVAAAAVVGVVVVIVVDTLFVAYSWAAGLAVTPVVGAVVVPIVVAGKCRVVVVHTVLPTVVMPAVVDIRLWLVRCLVKRHTPLAHSISRGVLMMRIAAPIGIKWYVVIGVVTNFGTFSPIAAGSLVVAHTPP
jgi:hypothetical protein